MSTADSNEAFALNLFSKYHCKKGVQICLHTIVQYNLTMNNEKSTFGLIFFAYVKDRADYFPLTKSYFILSKGVHVP